MLRKSLIVIAVCIAIAIAFAEGDNSTTSAPTTTSHSTVTTGSPNTTTAKPPTTPTTTTAEPPSTLAPPTKGHYNISNENGTCIMADFAVQVTVSIDNKTWEFDLPNNGSTNGSECNDANDELRLSWEGNHEISSFSFQFAKNETTKKYMVALITIVVPYNNESRSFTNSKPEFLTTVSKSYRCEKQQEIKLSEDSTNTTFAVLKMSHVQLQAFATSGDGKYSAAEDCAESSSPDIVPIAVGCALVVLIVVVLVAYLLGRRRSPARGYLSM